MPTRKAATRGRQTRADIRVTYDNFNVPVEIKKSHHQKLWKRNQDTVDCQIHP